MQEREQAVTAELEVKRLLGHCARAASHLGLRVGCHVSTLDPTSHSTSALTAAALTSAKNVLSRTIRDALAVAGQSTPPAAAAYSNAWATNATRYSVCSRSIQADTAQQSIGSGASHRRSLCDQRMKLN